MAAMSKDAKTKFCLNFFLAIFNNSLVNSLSQQVSIRTNPFLVMTTKPLASVRLPLSQIHALRIKFVPFGTFLKPNFS
jgi:hypothetical protein